LEIVKWLYENRKERFSNSALIDAAQNGHLEIIKLLVEIVKVDVDENIIVKIRDVANENGYLEIVQWLDYF